MDELKDAARLRLDAIKRAEDQDEDARRSGPFHREGALANLLVQVHDADRPAVSVAPKKPSVDILEKYKRPATDTTPHTTGLSDAERGEMSGDIDMERPIGKSKPNFKKD